jgi:hypothetical protein
MRNLLSLGYKEQMEALGLVYRSTIRHNEDKISLFRGLEPLTVVFALIYWAEDGEIDHVVYSKEGFSLYLFGQEAMYFALTINGCAHVDLSWLDNPVSELEDVLEAFHISHLFNFYLKPNRG